MQLEDQVVSLALAKRLKELSVKQDSLFWWRKNSMASEPGVYYIPDREMMNLAVLSGKLELECAAFTVAELGEMLPRRLPWESKDLFLIVYLEIYPLGTRKGWLVNYVAERDGITYSPYAEEAATEADARAKLLISLIEKKLITPPTEAAKGGE